ncbi:hypothetical protein JW826_06040 [Candidatus Woesearchaeota archaeon]|nr:hypothetical protein [Candidatus Woesearchaeota archaeon]
MSYSGDSPIDEPNKHDQYVEALCRRIEPRYDLILKHIPLYAKTRSSKRKRHSARKMSLVGEIDVLAYKGGSCDAYEVKCSYRVLKARKQLTRVRKLLRYEQKIRKSYFYCGESGKIELLEPKVEPGAEQED